MKAGTRTKVALFLVYVHVGVSERSDLKLKESSRRLYFGKQTRVNPIEITAPPPSPPKLLERSVRSSLL